MSLLHSASAQLGATLMQGLDADLQDYFGAAIDSLPEEALDRCRNTHEWKAAVNTQARFLAAKAKTEAVHQRLDTATAVSVNQAQSRRL